VHHDGGVRFGETHHLAQGTAPPMLRASACFGVRYEVAELAFASARIVEGGALRCTPRLQLRTANLDWFVRHKTHEKKS
jgi:hypothetical protein